MVNSDKNEDFVSSPNLSNDTTSMSGLLSFPSSEPSHTLKANSDSNHSSSSSSRHLLKDRLFIGNLPPTVDEYTLLQVFTKFGKVTKLDFLFHKTGALKGKPRGYAFLEYGSHNEAEKALNAANGKVVHGRKLVVTYANQAPLDADGGAMRQRKAMMETGRPTTLSMLKSNAGGRNKDGTSNKIAMMEAKLRELEAAKPNSNNEPGTSSLPASNLPTHPSLPIKPPPTIPNFEPSRNQRPSVSKHNLNSSLPPVLRASTSSSSVPHSGHDYAPLAKKIKLISPAVPSESTKRKGGGKGLLGVKITKKRVSPGPALEGGDGARNNVDHHHDEEQPIPS